MKLKLLFKNFSFATLSTVVTLALGIIIPKLILVNLGSETNGLVQSIGQVFTYVALLEMGVNATAIQALYKPIAKNDKDKINSILSAAAKYYTKFGMLYILCTVAIAFIYPFVVKTELSTLTVVLVILFTGGGGVINFILQNKYIIIISASGRSYVTTNINLVLNVLTSILKIVLLLMGYDIIAVQCMQFIITISRIIILKIYMQRKYGWIDYEVEPAKDALKNQNAVFINQLSYFVFSNTDVVLLSLFCDLKVVSVYSIYIMIIGFGEGLLSNIVNSTISLLGILYNESKERFYKIFYIYDNGYIILTYYLYTLILIFIEPFLMLYTKGVTDANYIDYKLAVLFVLLKFITTLRSQNQNLINISGHFKETLRSSIVEMIANLAISLILVQFMGIYGLLIGSIVSTAYKGIYLVRFTSKNMLKDGKGLTATSRFLNWGAMLVFGVAISFIGIRLLPQIDSYLMLIIYGAIYSLIIAVLMFVYVLIFNRRFCKYMKEYFYELRGKR